MALAYTSLIISEITSPATTTGVNRYVALWLEALRGLKIAIIYLRFEHSRETLFIKEEDHGHYRSIRVPMPEQMNTMANQRERWQSYLALIYPSISHYFTNGCLLHLHTLNLIDLALQVKQHVKCYTLMHLHCIPWKSLYNTNTTRFNTLMRNDTCSSERECYYMLPNEHDAYTKADHVACVTRSGYDFLAKQGISKERMSVVYNGLPDGQCAKQNYALGESVKCIFVGTTHRSKGLDFVLQALQRVHQWGYPIELLIAGYATPPWQAAVRQRYKELSLTFLGNLPYETLCTHYATADIGLIASLQEQCSYAAIEMMMHGLPIITTTIDGLGELFTHEKDCLAIDITHSEEETPTPDVDQIASHIVRLINDASLRQHLGQSARQRYLKQFTLETMREHTLHLYQKKT